MVTVTEILLALFSIIAGAAISESQMQSQNRRSAHDTAVRSWFDAIKLKFGITMDQLSQAASSLDIDLNRLTDAARGSARLSRASQVYREFVKMYPERIKAINNAKNIIQNAVNNLSSKEEAISSKIQQGKTVSKGEVAEAALGDVEKVNDTINEINTTLSGGKETPRTETIDTSMSNVPEQPKGPLDDLGKRPWYFHF